MSMTIKDPPAKERIRQREEQIEELSWQATKEIWDNLSGRAGFDQVMCELDLPIENEILGEIRKIIQGKLEEV